MLISPTGSIVPRAAILLARAGGPAIFGEENGCH
jgi:hypothetical protein